MDLRRFMLLVPGLAGALWIFGVEMAAGEQPASNGRPNILFLFTDDQRADTIRALGNQTIITPNLDRLVDRGFAFSNAYILGGNTGRRGMSAGS